MSKPSTGTFHGIIMYSPDQNLIKMNKLRICTKVLILSIGVYKNTAAQLTLSAQLRTRTELRDGQGSPLPKGADPAFFTSQRTRLNLGYNMYRLKFGLSIQDVRVWGQDISTINRTTSPENNGVMLHEAWGEISLTDTTLKNKALSLKIGRQELVYDDQRLIGNLDWLQQARRHDAAVLKYETKAWMLHAGAVLIKTGKMLPALFITVHRQETIHLTSMAVPCIRACSICMREENLLMAVCPSCFLQTSSANIIWIQQTTRLKKPLSRGAGAGQQPAFISITISFEWRKV